MAGKIIHGRSNKAAKRLPSDVLHVSDGAFGLFDLPSAAVNILVVLEFLFSTEALCSYSMPRVGLTATGRQEFPYIGMNLNGL